MLSAMDHYEQEGLMDSRHSFSASVRNTGAGCRDCSGQFAFDDFVKADGRFFQAAKKQVAVGA
jgi:hypothetical protein